MEKPDYAASGVLRERYSPGEFPEAFSSVDLGAGKRREFLYLPLGHELVLLIHGVDSFFKEPSALGFRPRHTMPGSESLWGGMGWRQLESLIVLPPLGVEAGSGGSSCGG